MDFLDLFYQQLLTDPVLPLPALYGAMGCMLGLFGIQLWYYYGYYGKIPKFRNNRGIRMEIPTPPVSVVVVVRENTYYFTENTLPLLLRQDYDAYEVVVVDCSYNEEIGHILEETSAVYPHMKLTQIKSNHDIKHSIKLALTVGIKAARYEHLILTTADSYPASEKWLSLMAKGFISGEVIIGYCGIEEKPGLLNKLIRCSRMATSVRYLSAAIAGKTYRGIAHNLGYTQSLYFGHKGFNHLNMNIGDDDLFVQQIARRNNVSIVMNPKATVRQIQYGGAGWWNASRKYFSHAFRYYPKSVRFSIGFELWSRLLFYAVCGILLAVLPLYWKTVPLVFFLIRLWLVRRKMKQIARRLGERKLMWAYILYDLYAPLTEGLLALSRRLRPNKAIWR